MDLRVVKKALRRDLMAKRRALGADQRLRFSREIAEKLIQEEAFEKASLIFSFMPMEEEVQLDTVFSEGDRLGKIFAFPVCFARGRMEAYLPRERSSMQKDAYGILSPDPEKDMLLEPEQIDLLIVPMLGFDRQLYRIGYGGGFYDRYLKRIRPNTSVIGVCFADLEVERVPGGVYDVPLPLLLTEKERLAVSMREI